MKKSKKLRLTLNRETVRTLNLAEAQAVPGGASLQFTCQSCVNVTCYTCGVSCGGTCAASCFNLC
ncbi:MAG: class I lanthipeptide [Thermoanaerobaculia bacterium]